MRFLIHAVATAMLLVLPAQGLSQENMGQYSLPEPGQPQYDALPLEELYEIPESESEEWFQFAPPTLVDWDGSFELGINGTEGNAQTFSMRTGGNLERETDRHRTLAEFTYARTETNSVKTQHNGLFRLEYERLFESPWTWWTRLGGEYDEFKAFDLRLALNTGLGYRFIDTDITKLKGRIGAGVSREYGGPNDDYVPEATFGLDFERKLTERQKFTTTMDYFPEFEDFTNYRLVTLAGWELVLDAESNLSLKLTLIDRYDSTPEGRKPNDLDYALLLLWKL